MLPSDFPPWQTVYGYFRRWRDNGTWQRIHRYLRQWVRLQHKRPQSPSVAIVDTQSVPLGCFTTGPEALMGASGSKAASATCWWTAWACCWRWSLPLPISLTGKGCRRCCAGPVPARLVPSPSLDLGRPGLLGTPAVRVGSGAVPLHAGGARASPRPWFPSGAPSLVVERTLAWISRCRRLGQDYEKHPRTSETFIYLAMIQLMLKRLA